MTDLNAALVQQFLNIPVSEWETVKEPNRVLDDGHRETVAVRLGVGHGGSAYPDPIKSTQPQALLAKIKKSHLYDPVKSHKRFPKGDWVSTF